MARNSVLDRYQSATRSGCRPARLRPTLLLAVVLAMGAGRPQYARGSGIFRDLTAKDRSQPILVSAAGEVISLRSPGHPASGLGSGALPAYLAFPLDGGEPLPAKTPSVTTGGQGVGPLDLTTAAQTQLNADLRTAKGVIVNAPGQSYAVAMLPRYARALAHSASSTSTATSGASGTSVITSILGLTPQANWTINGVSSSSLSKWISTGTKELSQLTSIGTSSVSKSLGLKVTPTSSGVNVAAQYLIPPSAESEAGSAPIAAPEPGAWLVFGLILGAAGLRCRAGR